MNHCDTRDDVLALYLSQTVKRGTCEVRSGTLVDPYTGVTEQFAVAVGYQPIQMDHVYSLHEAWDDGAKNWTPEQRLAYANDPSNLLPTALNTVKNDHGPADLLRLAADPSSKWKPSAEGQCTYARTFALTEAEYRLHPPEADAAALAAMLHACR